MDDLKLRRGVIRISSEDDFTTFDEDESTWFFFYPEEIEGPIQDEKGWVRGFKAHLELSTLPRLLVGYTIWDDNADCKAFCAPDPPICAAERFAIVDLTRLFDPLPPIPLYACTSCWMLLSDPRLIRPYPDEIRPTLPGYTLLTTRLLGQV